ncbi:hypothetical protein [Raineyella fluvialis]|uniref:Antibiotic biosynthesis monooxygenase n=1 Tax=Raineyella fluvialis TaxID=2662261 RepID=A0A5Q2FKL3_9ACTN|nr:hypothetical protein [Raineyella fluvialis]QGF24886.1 hypothetical protein Rai3103_16080 [Raineyella fluvialis]
MFSRQTTTEGFSDPQTLIDQISTTVLPGASAMQGFRGISVFGDPATSTRWTFTDWDRVDDLIASRSGARDLRRRATEGAGSTVHGVREWDVPVDAASDRPLTSGLPVNVNRHFYDPALIHEIISFFAWVAEPMYRSSPGFRAVRMLVDRTTGEVLVGSVWDDVASLEEGFDRLEPIRDRAVEKGMKFAGRARLDLLFAATP